MARIMIFLIGFGLSIIGFVFIISYLNLLTLGYNFQEYANFIIRKPECQIGMLGLIITYLSIYYKGGKDELYLWCDLKL